MFIRSLTYQQSAFKRCHSGKHFSQSFYLQDGGKNQLTDMEQNYATVALCIVSPRMYRCFSVSRAPIAPTAPVGRWIDWLRATERVRSQQRDRCGAVGGLGRRDDNAARVGVKKIDWRCHSINIASIIQLRRRRRRWSAADCMRRPPAWYSHTVAPPGGKGRGSSPPMGGRPKIMQYVCAFIVVELHRITRQIHCKAVEQRATLIYTDNTTGTGGLRTLDPL